MHKRTGLLVFIALVLVCTGARAQQDPFVGVWKQNLAKSKYEPADKAFKAFTIRIEATGNNAWKVTQDWGVHLNGEGGPSRTEFAVTLDGNDYPHEFGQWDTVAMKKLNANSIITVNKKGGNAVRMILMTLSEDGRTLTHDSVGYGVNGATGNLEFHSSFHWYHNIVTFDKQ